MLVFLLFKTGTLAVHAPQTGQVRIKAKRRAVRLQFATAAEAFNTSSCLQDPASFMYNAANAVTTTVFPVLVGIVATDRYNGS